MEFRIEMLGSKFFVDYLINDQFGKCWKNWKVVGSYQDAIRHINGVCGHVAN